MCSFLVLGLFTVLTSAQEHSVSLAGHFELVIAFSRLAAQKIYVQNRLWEHRARVNTLLQNGGYVYVCGSAGKMARDVHQTIVDVLVAEQGIAVDKARLIVEQMKKSSKYQVSNVPFFSLLLLLLLTHLRKTCGSATEPGTAMGTSSTIGVLNTALSSLQAIICGSDSTLQHLSLFLCFHHTSYVAPLQTLVLPHFFVFARHLGSF